MTTVLMLLLGIKQKSWELTTEGKEVLANGRSACHEATVYRAVHASPAAGHLRK